MDSALKMVQWTVYGLAALIWIGALVFAGYRNHQLKTLKPVRAEVIEAATEGYMSSHYGEDSSGWRVETQSKMYSAVARVKYEFGGRQYEAEASHDVGVSWAWVQDRLTREWKPGAKIWVHIDPAKPDQPTAGLGYNLNTFLPSVGMILFGWVIWAMGYGLGRLLPLLQRIQENLPGGGQFR